MGRGLAWVCGSGWDPLWGGTVGKNCLDLLALKQGILVHRRLDAGGMRSLVIDLRGNPGGLLDAAIDMTNQFVKKGETSRDESKFEIITVQYDNRTPPTLKY